MAQNTLVRTLHDVGLATWFGGSLMGAVGLNGAAAQVSDPRQRSRAATAGWTRWVPVSAAGIGAHLIGAVSMLAANSDRVRSERDLAASSAVKTALTAAALGTTAYSGVLNRKMASAGDVPVQGATEAGPGTSPQVANTLKQLKAVQWLIPSLTGALVSVSALQGEQLKSRPAATDAVRRVARQLPTGAFPLPLVLGVGAGSALLLAKRRKQKTGRDVQTSYSPPVSVPPPTSSVGVGAGTDIGANRSAPGATPARDVSLPPQSVDVTTDSRTGASPPA